MPQLYCQHYFGLLKGLIFAEKAVIARIYPIIAILKLQSNNSFNFKSYKSVSRYFVFFHKI